MGFYRDVVLPRLLHLAMQNREVARHRQDLVPLASGRVLEVGLGSGLNLPFYGPEVAELVGLDPSPPLLNMARERAADRPFAVELVQEAAEAVPFADDSFDSLVMTWTLCSVADPLQALGELRRVLRPGGRLLFIEHGRAESPAVVKWQDRLNPVWRRCAGGCNLNRPIEKLIREAGFAIERLETGHLVKGPRPLTFHSKGLARPGSSRAAD